MFLMIENAGVASVKAFTVMGLSTARGDKAKIGQFGSGSKHGILTCMRQGIVPTIFLGNNPLRFATTTDKMGDKEYQHLLYEFQNEIKELPIALECGALDWTGLDMGLREFVSNAIDAGGHRVDVVGSVEPHPDKTRIFLPFNPDVAKFYGALREKFLHFSPEFKIGQTVIPKELISKGKFYRKGIFVRESRDLSLFDYNVGDEVKIDESRNMDEWTVKHHVSRLWEKTSADDIKLLLSKISTLTEKHFEYSLQLSYYYLVGGQKKVWVDTWNSLYGENAVCGEPKTQGQLIGKAVNKGFTVISVPPAWLDFFTSIGIPTVNSKLDGVDEKGRQIKPTGPNTLAKVTKIWNKLADKGMTNGKEMPKVNTFVSLMDGNTQKCGFWNPVDNSINLELTTGINSITILEELGHYITRADDNSRDFQDYFIKLATICLKV